MAQPRQRGSGGAGGRAPFDWPEVERALRHELARVAGLLRSVRRPEAPAVGRWTLADVAVHVSQALVIIRSMARADLADAMELLPGRAPTSGGSLIGDLWEFADVTMLGVRSDPERSPAALADRIEERAEAFFEQLGGDPAPDRLRPWVVEGVRVDRRTLGCHLLNEVMVHGRDMARADGRRWPLDRRHAAMVVDGFLLPVISSLGPRTMVDQERAAGFKARFDVRIRGGGRWCFAFDDGAMAITPTGPGPVDCHLSVDPAGFLLVAWGRASQWQAIARGQLLAWGRRPWLGLRLRGLVRNP